MTNVVCQATFSISDFYAGASSLQVAVQENYTISGWYTPVSGETSGTVNVTVQFWAGDKPLGQQHYLPITQTAPPGNSMAVPEGATQVVLAIEKATIPMCTVVLGVSAP